MALHHITSKEEFDKLVAGGKPVLVDFYAEWCGPCQVMGPMIEEMAENFEHADKVEIAKLDVDKVPDVSETYGVMSIPTFIIFDGGKPAETLVGSQPIDAIKSKLSAHIKN
ncbi:MAG TPA: thioredoxin [bacterium]|nr:thioredoxin [bacterium]